MYFGFCPASTRKQKFVTKTVKHIPIRPCKDFCPFYLNCDAPHATDMVKFWLEEGGVVGKDCQQ